MEGFTIIDGVVALVVVVSALLAYGRGLVREVLAIAGWIVAAILAYMFAPEIEPMVREIPVLGEMLGTNCNEISIIFAFSVLLVVGLIIFSLFSPMFAALVQRSALGGIDQGLGFLFGVARGALLVAIAFFVYQIVVGDQALTIVNDSRSFVVFEQLRAEVEQQDPEAALGWITGRSEELVATCGN